MTTQQIPDKLYFRIGEVAAIVGVKSHVLRYWEEEFPLLRPANNVFIDAKRLIFSWH